MAMIESQAAPAQQASIPASVISTQVATLQLEAKEGLRALSKQFQEGNYTEMKHTASNVSSIAAKLEGLTFLSKFSSSSKTSGSSPKQSGSGGNGGFLSSLRIEKKA